MYKKANNGFSRKPLSGGVEAFVQVYDLGEEFGAERYARLSVYTKDGKAAFGRSTTVVQVGSTVELSNPFWGRTVVREGKVLPADTAIKKAVKVLAAEAALARAVEAVEAANAAD